MAPVRARSRAARRHRGGERAGVGRHGGRSLPSDARPRRRLPRADAPRFHTLHPAAGSDATRFAGVTRHVPPSPGSIILVPAGIPVQAHSSGSKDALYVYMEPGVVERVAAEAFELDPSKVSIPALYGL